MGSDTAIKDRDVYWEMDWKEPKGMFPNKPETELIYEDAMGLARLLAEGIIHINQYWWKEDWPEEAQKSLYMGVLCSDTFDWACADSVEIIFTELQSLYDMWIEDRYWGSTRWCAIKLNRKPIDPIIQRMKKDGVWDDVMEGLNPN